MEHFIQLIYPLIQNGAKASIDSRTVGNNSIFFALKGNNHDGNDYALKAIEDGALLAIADNNSLPEHKQLIKVDNVLIALQVLAKYHRNQLKIPVIGITGSNGKTTSKELINAVLSRKFKTLSTEGNYNNHIGLPLTILNIRPFHEIAVIEMGANHLNEIEFLCSIAQPTSGLITNVGKAHIEGFGSEANVVKGKTELYRYLENQNKIVFLNTNHAVLKENCHSKNMITYGLHPNNNYRGAIISSFPFLKVHFSYGENEKSYSTEIQTKLIGDYNLENILAAASIGRHYGVELADIKESIESYTPQNNRSQFINSGKNQLIMDAYNANPNSMELAIKNFSRIQYSPKACILGDMLELGQSAKKEHEKIISLLSAEDFSLIILVGSEFSTLKISGKNIFQFNDYQMAQEWIIKNPITGYAILIKGSRGISLEKLEHLL